MSKGGWGLAFAVLFVVVASSVGVFGSAPLSGSFEMSVAFNPSAPTLAGFVQTDSDTYSKLIVSYSLSEWIFKNTTSFDLSGLSAVRFEANGELGVFALSSKMDFYPGTSISLAFTSGTDLYAPLSTDYSHVYKMPQTRYVLWLKVAVENLNSSDLDVSTSADGNSWTPVTLDSSGEASPNRKVLYVKIDAGTTKIESSTLTVRYSGINWATPSKSWRTSCKWSFGGISLSGRFTLANGSSNLLLGFKGPRNDVLNIAADVKFDLNPHSDCSFSFNQANTTLKFPFACIDEVTAKLKATCGGFDYVSFKVSHIETGLSWLDLSGTVKFTTSDKTLTMTPKLVLANASCIKVYGKLVTGDSTMEITGVSIYGIGLKHTWNGVSFESLSYLDSSHYVKENYWEKFVITSKGDTCCGGKLKFEVATYFQATHDTLFDWAETDIDLSIGLTSTFTASTGVEVDTRGFTKLVIAFKTTW